MRRESLYLSDILAAADYIAQSIERRVRNLLESEIRRSAVVQKLSVIGEAAGRVSGELTSRYPEVPWPQMITFCNILVHAYFGIDWELVWQSAKNRCPVLRNQIAHILGQEH